MQCCRILAPSSPFHPPLHASSHGAVRNHLPGPGPLEDLFRGGLWLVIINKPGGTGPAARRRTTPSAPRSAPRAAGLPSRGGLSFPASSTGWQAPDDALLACAEPAAGRVRVAAAWRRRRVFAAAIHDAAVLPACGPADAPSPPDEHPHAAGSALTQQHRRVIIPTPLFCHIVQLRQRVCPARALATTRSAQS